jgi:uncharacterized membrane protein YkoI
MMIQSDFSVDSVARIRAKNVTKEKITMMRSRAKRIVVPILGCSVALTAGIFGMKAEGQGAKQSKAAVPAEQVIASIRTAVAAKPGDVRAVETENENGKTICEVEVLAQDGKTYEVEVDVETNTVIEVEVDND